MKDKIIKALENHPEIAQWTLSSNRKEKRELYLIFNHPETVRQIEQETHQITIYVNLEHQGQNQTGSASISLLPDTNQIDIENQLNEAVFAAKLALNPAYRIAEKSDEEINYEICDPQISTDPDNTINSLHSTLVNSIEQEKNIKMSSAEIMLSVNHRNLVTSNGLKADYQDSEILFELVLLSGKGKKEVETFTLRNERFLDVLDIENLVKRYANYTRDNVNAVLPETGKYSIILTEEPLATFFNYYAYQTSAAALFNKSSHFEINKPVVESPNGTLLNMYYDPGLRGGLRSKPYDQYGFPLKKFQIIENGIFVGAQADNKYGQYLGLPVTGASSNIVIKPGTLSLPDLLEDNVFIFSRFSSFDPDPVTGAFSGEIRNGLLFKDNSFIPVKGGSVTGVIDDAMRNVSFSRETIQGHNYFGPRYVKLRNIDVTG